MADVTVPTGNFVCECCGLWYPIQRPVSGNGEDRMHRSNKIPTRCSRCASHRGYESDVDILFLRADDHTRWYWEWYKNAVEAARAARRQVDEAEVRVDEAQDRTVSAYRSRDHSSTAAPEDRRTPHPHGKRVLVRKTSGLRHRKDRGRRMGASAHPRPGPPRCDRAGAEPATQLRRHRRRCGFVTPDAEDEVPHKLHPLRGVV